MNELVQEVADAKPVRQDGGAAQKQEQLAKASQEQVKAIEALNQEGVDSPDSAPVKNNTQE